MKELNATTLGGSVKVNVNDINQLTKDRLGDIVAFIDNDPEEYIIKPGQLNEKSVLPNLHIYRHDLDTLESEKLIVDLTKSKKLKTVYINYYLLNAKNTKTFNKIKTIYMSNGNKDVLKNLFPTYQISNSEYVGVFKLTKSGSASKPKAGPSKPNCKKYGCTVKPRNGEFCSKHK